MANFELTRQEIREDALGQLRLESTQGNIQTLANRQIDKTIAHMNSIDEFEWTWDREIVQTEIDKTAGTVSVATDGTSVTGSGTAFAATDVGRFIQFSSDNNWYKVTAHSSATSITIETGYVGTTNLSAGTYTLRKKFYSLSSSASRYIVVKQAITPIKLRTFHPRTFDQHIPFGEATGDAQVIVFRGYDSSNNVQFEVYPYADEKLNLEFLTKKRPQKLASDTDVPNIPSRWHEAIVDGVISRMSRFAGSTNTNYGQNLQVYNDWLRQMKIEENNKPDWHPILQTANFFSNFDDDQPLSSDSPISG